MNIYNVINHRLNAEKLRKLNEFSTDLYGGVIANSSISNVFSYSNNKVSINSSALIAGELYIICGGCLVTLTNDDLNTLPSPLTNQVYYLQVVFDFAGDTIASDNSTSVTLVGSTYVPAEINAYIQYGQSIAITNGFKVPLFRWTGSAFTSIVKAKDKASAEDWLTQNAIDDLWNTLNSTFVHQSGSSQANPTYGQLGNFNVNGNTITHNNAGFITATNSHTLQLNSAYTVGPAVINSNHELSSVTVLPMSLGGTGTTARGPVLKNNLGIFWGTSVPTSTTIENPQRGDLYFRILT